MRMKVCIYVKQPSSTTNRIYFLRQFGCALGSICQFALFFRYGFNFQHYRIFIKILDYSVHHIVHGPIIANFNAFNYDTTITFHTTMVLARHDPTKIFRLAPEPNNVGLYSAMVRRTNAYPLISAPLAPRLAMNLKDKTTGSIVPNAHQRSWILVSFTDFSIIYGSGFVN